MPTRSLSSSVLKWPDRPTVDQAVRAWGTTQAQKHPELLGLGYFGSYAPGRLGVGSDVELLAVVAESEAASVRRALSWDAPDLPVPVELIVYTNDEWLAKARETGHFARSLVQETEWGYRRPSAARI